MTSDASEVRDDILQLAAAPATRTRGTDNYTEPDLKKAKKQHRKRYFAQFWVWGLMMALSAISSPLLIFLFSISESPCTQSSWLNSVFTCHSADGFLTVLGLIGGALLIYHYFFYYDKQKQNWEVALSDSQATLNTHKTAVGYTGLFKIYVQTKRRSYQLLSIGLLILVFAISYLIIINNSHLAAYGVGKFNGSLLAILFAIACGFLRLSYLLGSQFAPGEVIVKHTVALAFLAVSSINDIGEARRQIEERTNEFRKQSPWWFIKG